MKTLINKYARNYDISRHPFSEVYHRMMMEYNRVKQKYKRQYRDKIRYKLENFHSNKPVLYSWLNHNQMTLSVSH